MKKWKKTALIIGAIAVLTGLVIGGIVWSKRGTISVQAGHVTREDLAAIVTASGQIKPPPENYASVNANSFGKIIQLLVKEGDHVKKGQLLLRTEDIQQLANVDAQKAALKTEEADADAMDAAVHSASAALRTAEADLGQAQAKFGQTKDDYGRGQQLLKDKLIAQQVFDQRRSDYQVAGAAVQSAEARVIEERSIPPLPEPHIHLALAVSRFPVMDAIVEKARFDSPEAAKTPDGSGHFLDGAVLDIVGWR